MSASGSDIEEDASGSFAGSQVGSGDDASQSHPEPTEEEILDYASYIGIDVEKEPHLMWIAKEGVAAPVPKPWVAHQEGEGEDAEVFYFNPETQQSTWDHPSDEHFKAMLEKHRALGPEGAREKSGDEDMSDEDIDRAEDSRDKGSASGSAPPSPKVKVGLASSVGQKPPAEPPAEAAGEGSAGESDGGSGPKAGAAKAKAAPAVGTALGSILAETRSGMIGQGVSAVGKALGSALGDARKSLQEEPDSMDQSGQSLVSDAFASEVASDDGELDLRRDRGQVAEDGLDQSKSLVSENESKAAEDHRNQSKSPASEDLGSMGDDSDGDLDLRPRQPEALAVGQAIAQAADRGSPRIQSSVESAGEVASPHSAAASGAGEAVSEAVERAPQPGAGATAALATDTGPQAENEEMEEQIEESVDSDAGGKEEQAAGTTAEIASGAAPAPPPPTDTQQEDANPAMPPPTDTQEAAPPPTETQQATSVQSPTEMARDREQAALAVDSAPSGLLANAREDLQDGASAPPAGLDIPHPDEEQQPSAREAPSYAESAGSAGSRGSRRSRGSHRSARRSRSGSRSGSSRSGSRRSRSRSPTRSPARSDDGSRSASRSGSRSPRARSRSPSRSQRGASSRSRSPSERRDSPDIASIGSPADDMSPSGARNAALSLDSPKSAGAEVPTDVQQADVPRSPHLSEEHRGQAASLAKRSSSPGSARSGSSDGGLDAGPSVMLRGPVPIDEEEGDDFRSESRSPGRPESPEDASARARLGDQDPPKESVTIAPTLAASGSGGAATSAPGQGGETAPGAAEKRPPVQWDKGNYSSRSSNLSEISEEFRSDWGAQSQPNSARKGNLETESLEISASLDTETSSTGNSHKRLSPDNLDRVARGNLGTVSEHGDSERDSEGGPSLSTSKPKAWNELYADLCALSSILDGIKEVRSKQQEYLHLLKVGK